MNAFVVHLADLFQAHQSASVGGRIAGLGLRRRNGGL